MWVTTPTMRFPPWSASRAWTTWARVSGSRVPKPSSRKRLSSGVAGAAFGSETGEPLGQGESQGQRGQEGLAAGERLHRAVAVGVPVVDDRELLVVHRERIAAERKRLQATRAVARELAQRLLLDEGQELVGAQVLGEGAGQGGLGVERLLLSVQLEAPGQVLLEPFDGRLETRDLRVRFLRILLDLVAMRLE